MYLTFDNFDFILVWFSLFISIFILISWPWNGWKLVECTLVDDDRVFFVACIFISLINPYALGLALKHWSICWTPVTTGCRLDGQTLLDRNANGLVFSIDQTNSFIRPESNHCLALSTDWLLTNSLMLWWFDWCKFIQLYSWIEMDGTVIFSD